jgi:hypothetical protein
VAGGKEGDSEGGKGNGNGDKVAGNKEGNASIIYNINRCITMTIYQCTQWKKTYV